MKKISILASLTIICMLQTQSANAQFTTTNVNPTTTTNDVSIQTTLNQGNLTVFRNAEATTTGNVVTFPKPGLSILSYEGMLNANGCLGCTYANTINPDFEIVGATYSNGAGGGAPGVFLGYNSPKFTIGGDCQMKVGGAAKIGFNNAIYGVNYLNDHTLIRGKVRLTNVAATINAPSWTTANFPYTFSVDYGNSRFVGDARIEGKVRIGAMAANGAYANYALSVDGDIICKRNVVQTGSWADYVFATDYKLKPLAEVENYIKTNKHLPDMPSQAQVIANGQDVGEIQKLQQAKIEELTLYLIELKKELDAVKAQLNK